MKFTDKLRHLTRSNLIFHTKIPSKEYTVIKPKMSVQSKPQNNTPLIKPRMMMILMETIEMTSIEAKI